MRMCRQLDGILPHAIIMALTSIAAVTVSTDALPLKISPRDGNTSLQFLKEWMAANKDWLDQKLLEHGRPLYIKPAVKLVNAVYLLLCWLIKSHLAVCLMIVSAI